MPSLKRLFASGLGRVVGAEIVATNRVNDWLENRFIRQLLVALNVDCVFDVGANRGQFGRLLRASAFQGMIVSFEPGPSAYSDLQKAARGDERWETHNLALGATESKMPLSIMKEDVFSSFRVPSQNEDASYGEQNQVKTVVEVEVRPIDDMFRELAQRLGFQRPFLKMDTQGFDLEVIKGAEQTLPHFVGLSSEIAIRRLYEGSPTMTQSIEAIIERGFDFVNLMPVHPDRLLNPLELNSYAVRRDLAR